MTDTENQTGRDAAVSISSIEAPRVVPAARASWLMRLLVSLLLVLVVGLGFSAVWLWQRQVEASNQFAQLDERLDALTVVKDKIRVLESRQRETEADLSAQAASVNTLEARAAPLIARQVRLSSIALVTELNYLLRTASLALTLSRDVVLADQLLKEAVNLVGRENLPGLDALKEALKEDRARLTNHKGLDVSATYLSLASLAHWVTEQSTTTAAMSASLKVTTESEEANRASSASNNSWQGLAERALERLASLVDFRKNQPPIRLGPSTGDAALLLQNQLLLLKTAQLALLERNQAVFDISMAQFEADAERFYSLAQGDPMILTMKSLRAIEIDIEPPVIDASLGAFERFRAKLEEDGR
ncbi:MAG: uroporphyrinogen-III C-methyltransferase [Pseudomonadales bacterium]